MVSERMSDYHVATCLDDISWIDGSDVVEKLKLQFDLHGAKEKYEVYQLLKWLEMRGFCDSRVKPGQHGFAYRIGCGLRQYRMYPEADELFGYTKE
jgi:hypothetical protein